MNIVKVDQDNFERVLPLIADYQRFYEVPVIDEAHNRSFFGQFVDANDRGVLHLLEYDDTPVGFSTIYYCFSSALAQRVAVLNDLYVAPGWRGNGLGRALIDHAATYVKAQGVERLQWLTAQNNVQAQRLYDNTSAKKSAWFFYAMST